MTVQEFYADGSYRALREPEDGEVTVARGELYWCLHWWPRMRGCSYAASSV